MEYKNQTENRAFQEMLQAAVKRLQNRSGEDLAAKSGAVFHSSRNVLEVLSFYETIEIQLPEFRINSDMDEWHYLTLLHYLDMADGTEGSQKLITFGNLKDGLIRGTKFDRTAEQKLEKLLQDKDPYVPLRSDNACHCKQEGCSGRLALSHISPHRKENIWLQFSCCHNRDQSRSP